MHALQSNDPMVRMIGCSSYTRMPPAQYCMHVTHTKASLYMPICTNTVLALCWCCLVPQAVDLILCCRSSGLCAEESGEKHAAAWDDGHCRERNRSNRHPDRSRSLRCATQNGHGCAARVRWVGDQRSPYSYSAHHTGTCVASVLQPPPNQDA